MLIYYSPQIYVASLGTGSGGGGSSLAPISAADTATATENVATVNLIPSMVSNDSDPSPSDTITVTAVDTSGTLGTLSFDVGSQSLTYLAGSAFDDLSAGATRNDSFAYTITDSTGLTSTNTVSVTVTGVNDAPVNTVTAGYTTEEDVTLNVSGLSVTEIDTLDVLSVTLQVSQGSLYVIGTVAGGLTAGQITGNSSGSVTLTGSAAAINATLAHGSGVSFTAPANFNGQSTLTMTTSDGTASDSDTATITITPTNDAPIAQSDSYAVAEDGTLTIGGAAGVLANDADSVDSPANGLTATLVSGVTHGTLTLNGDGSFTYTPNADYNGSDSFSYRAVDDGTPNLQSEVVTVTLGVTAVNDAPVNTLPLAYNTAEDTSVVLNGLSVADIDDADTILTVTLGVAQGTLNVTDGISGGLEASAISGNNTGSVTLTGTASAINTTLANITGVSFNPPANQHGDITFTLTTTDGVATDTDTAVIAVLSVNDAPVAQAESYIATEDTPLVVSAGAGLLANDADVNDTPPDALSAVLITGTAHGTLTLNTDGSFTYTANTDYAGTDSFAYRVVDNGTPQGESNIVTVNLTVNGVNDASVLSNLTSAISFNENAVNAAPDRIDTDVTLVDIDSDNFADGNVTISLTGGTAFDQLNIAHTGTGAGVIGRSGNDITYGGVVIGSLNATNNGLNGASLVVDLNANATTAAVEALLENLTYANTSNTPAATRGIAITVADGDGGVSVAQNTVITVIAEPDNLNLTAGVDSIVGSMDADTISGSAAHLGATDTVQGGLGIDTLNFTTGTLNLNTTSVPNLGGIENFILGTNAAHSLTVGNSYFSTTGMGNVLSVITTPAFTTGITVNGSGITSSGFALNVTGNAGADRLTGGAGNDTLVGGNGNDSITAGAGDDSIDAGAGNDTVTINGGNLSAADTVLGGAGTDTLATTSGVLVANTLTMANLAGFETFSLNTNASHNVTIGDSYYTSAGFTGTRVTVTSNSTVGIKVDASGVTTTTRTVSLTSGNGNDTLIGGAGNDTMTSGNGNDSLIGGAGNDYFYFNAAHFGAGDTIAGGAGNTDLIYINAGTAAITAAHLTNVSSVERIYVNNAAAHVVAVDDAVFNTGLNATSFMIYANTALTASLNFNGSAIANSANHLTLQGAKGNDTLTGGAGNDSITGYIGNDSLTGGAGNDVFLFTVPTEYTSADTIIGGTGLDTVSLSGGTGAFVLNSGSGVVSGIETFSLNRNGAHSITLTDGYFATAGLQGTTIIMTTNSTTGVNFSALGAVAAHGFNLNLTSGNGNDTLQGSTGNDTLTSGIGNDSLAGGAGNDLFNFAAATNFTSADSIAGGLGNDTVSLTGGTGAFVLNTDTAEISGIETFSLNPNGAHSVTLTDNYFAAGDLSGAVTVTSNSTTAVNFTAAAVTNSSSAVNLISSSANDTLIGGAGNDTLNAGTGNDIAQGGAGNDLIINGSINNLDTFAGGDGIDTLRTNGGTFNFTSGSYANLTGIERFELNNNAGHYLNFVDSYFDSTGFEGDVVTITTTSTSGLSLNATGVTNTANRFDFIGFSGNDTVIGGAGADTLNGGAGTDSLRGHSGADILTGGAGNDSFLFNFATDSGIGAGNRDIITDFTAGDRINLGAFAGTFAFRAGGLGEANFTGSAAQVAFQQTGGNTLVFVDTNGDRVTDFQIELAGLVALSSGSFVL